MVGSDEALLSASGDVTCVLAARSSTARPCAEHGIASISLLPDCSNHSARYKSTCMKLKWVADLPKCLRLAR